MGIFDRVGALFTTQDPTGRFWEWFRKNQDRFARLDEEAIRERLFDELRRELDRVDKNLVFEFSIGPVNGAREFIVSADGISSSFPSVRTLVDAAPEIPGWRIVAFRRRMRPLSLLEIGDLKLDPERIWFRSQPSERAGRVDVMLSVEGYTEALRNPYRTGIFLMLDHLLGEYDVETKVGGIGVEALPDRPAERGMRPFLELADGVDLVGDVRN